MANPIAIAAKGKGYTALWKRARAINQRYGLTASKMDRALRQFAAVLKKYNCGATFPITTSALARNGATIAKYQAQNIEFAMHGLFHIDYSQLSLTQQVEHIRQASQKFQQAGVQLSGFRCPYLRWNEDTLRAVSANGLKYDSSQALYWEVAQTHVNEDYYRVLEFYRARPAQAYPALPALQGDILQIPYCVPDDESIIDRFKLVETGAMSEIWLAILEQTYQLGELFTLGLHPERIGLLETPLAAALAQARQLSPQVWITRLDEITGWWQARRETKFELVEEGERRHLAISGPPGVTPLARGVTIQAKTQPWAEGFEQVLAQEFYFQAERRPCIGLAPESSPALQLFLKEQGYWVEVSAEAQAYSIYLDQKSFQPEDKRPLLAQLARLEGPLIRVGRWPQGARSAMCVTGDIDALTLWDYGLRFLGS